jgi:PAT family beta-lactamase induction signal transducer AmpG
MNDTPTEKMTSLRWRDSLLIYLSPSSLRMLTLGFAAGLPLLLVLGTLSFRLREAGIDRAMIGFLSWVGLAYGFKWAWAPLVDRLPIPWFGVWLGRRRSWLLLSQACVIAGLLGMAMSNPQQSLAPLVGFALLTAFGSATQDIALDAFRIESAQARLQAVLAASYQTGYRLAMIWAGAGVFWIAAKAETVGLPVGTYQDHAWAVAYVALPPAHNLREWLSVAVVDPFAEFIRRYRWHAVLLLALIGTYRISDIVMGIMANPFYVDMGYTKEEVATVTKLYGVVMTLVGAFIGGVMVLRWGVMKVLMIGAVLSAATNLLFAWLAMHGHDVYGLIAVVSADNLGSGIASAAFIAYLSSLTNVQYSATQYALFSSLMLLAPKFLAGFSGLAVDAAGYAWFFTGTALLGVPVLWLVWLASRFHVAGDSPR